MPYEVGSKKNVQTNAEAASDSSINAADRECLGSCFAYSCYCCTYCLMFFTGKNTDDIDGS